MIIDKFHQLYNRTFNIKDVILNKCKIPAVLRLLIATLANISVPIYFKVFNQSKKYTLNNTDTEQTRFVVTLTSFPNRIGNIYLVIESLLRQTYAPKSIILWLSNEQFSGEASLPRSLLRLKERGLEIRFTDKDLRSYKKYYFLLTQQPSASFIIVDDDIFYPSNTLQNLVDAHKKFPNAVCANRCIQIESSKNYSDWNAIRGEAIGPAFDLLPTGCGGVLYPENSLHSDAVNEELFTEICKDADDIWLSSCAYLNGTKTVYTGYNEYLIPVNSINNQHLHTKNVGESMNDIRIASVKNYYSNKLNVDVFER